jgi:hypothetical protein
MHLIVSCEQVDDVRDRFKELERLRDNNWVEPEVVKPKPARAPAAKPAMATNKPAAASAKPDAKAEARQRLMAAKRAMMQKQKDADNADIFMAASPQPAVTVWTAEQSGPRTIFA